MAWIVRRKRRGREQVLVAWRDPVSRRIRSRIVRSQRADGYVSVDRADGERRRVELKEEGPPKGRTAPGIELLEPFLASLATQGRTAETVRYYRGHLEPLARAWRHLRCDAWARGDLERWLASHPKWSPRTRQMLVVALRTWRRWALASGYLMADPTAGLRLATVRPRERRAWSAVQLRAILRAAAGTDAEVAVYLATYAGLALGDLRALTWEEVDLEAGWLRRRRAKTGELIEIPLAPPLRALLTRVRQPSGPVVVWPPSDCAQRSRLRRVCAAAGVRLERGDGWHSLRHSYASLLAGQGVSVADLRAFLGHRPGSAVTLRYLHPDRARMEAAAAVLAKAIDRPRA